MKQINYKKLILPNIPYVFIALLITKVSEAARLAPGADLSGKLLNIMTGMSTAFQSIMPSFHPIDLCVGIAAAVVIRLVVYFKGKNAKKFRKNLEYGSARWGNADDIRPYPRCQSCWHLCGKWNDDPLRRPDFLRKPKFKLLAVPFLLLWALAVKESEI